MASRRFFKKSIYFGLHTNRLGPSVFLLLSQTALLSGSDVGSNGVKPASSFVFRNLVKERDLICAWTNESPEVIELNPNCSGQAHPNKSDTSPGYEHTKHDCILEVFSVQFIIDPLKSADSKSGTFV